MLTKALQADKQPSFRAFCVLGALLFLAVWGLRLETLQGAYHPDDSPEITAAMAGLGLTHPPGYPLPTLLGHLAIQVLPGGPAFAANSLAAFWSALAVLLALGLLTRQLDLAKPGDRLWLAVAAVALATLPQLWFQGLSSKGGLYTLNLCLTLGALLALMPPSDSVLGRPTGAPAPKLALGWFLVGLGLANHYMSVVLFLPTLAYWSWTARPGWRPQLRLWLFSLPGLAIYLYLPLRAAFHPAMNWGNPDTWPRLKAVLLRQMYSGAESGQDLGNALHLGRHFLALWQEQWHLLSLALLFLGLAPLWRRDRAWRPLLLGLGLYLAVVLAYNHPPRNAPWVINAFFLPVYVLAGMPLLAGAQRLRGWLPDPGARALPWALLGLLLLLAPLRWRANDLSRDYLLHDYAKDLLLVPPPGTTLLAAGGNDAFPVWYQQQVLGRRQDLTLVDVPLVSDWYLDQLRSRLPELRPEWRDKDTVVAGLLAAPLHPLYYSSHNPGDRGIPLGLVALVPRPGQPLRLSAQGLLDPWKAVRFRWVADTRTALDGNREELLSYYPDSAAALKAFAQRQGVAPLAQAAERLEQHLRQASRPPAP